jgi:hypothetical protein
MGRSVVPTLLTTMKHTINWNDPQDASMGKFIGKAMAEAFEDAMQVHGPADAYQAWAEAFTVVYDKVHRMMRHEDKVKADPRDKEFLRRCAKEIGAEIPDGWGFILFMFNFGPGGHMTYTSNADRKEAIAAMKEWLLKVGPEEWLKHVE